jgi:hypothetical protein
LLDNPSQAISFLICTSTSTMDGPNCDDGDAPKPKPPCDGGKRHWNQRKHWIPKEVYCPSSSAITEVVEGSHCPPSEGGNICHHGGDDDDVSSIGASSATSISAGRKTIGNNGGGYLKHHGGGTDVAAMVESTYNDLENIVPSPSLPTPPPSPVKDGVDAFDPFSIDAACESFAGCRDHFASEEDRHWPAGDRNKSDRGDPGKWASTDDGSTLEGFPAPDELRILGIAHDVGVDPNEPNLDRPGSGVKPPKVLSAAYSWLVGGESNAVPTTIAITPRKATRRLPGEQKREKKTKMKVTVPLHARVEMLHHQAQKPFRTVSQLVQWSATMLHDTIFDGPDPGERPTTGPSLFHRGISTNKRFSLNDTMSTSSIPAVQNVTSLDSSESESWDEESELASNCSRPHRQRREGTSPAIERCRPQGASKTAQEDPERDLRWLFARQLLPVATSYQVKGSGTIHSQQSL